MSKKSFHGYFYYTRLERNACIILSVLTLLFFLLPITYSFFFPPKETVDLTPFREKIAELDRREAEKPEPKPPVKPAKVEAPARFEFDPNTATRNDLEKLGIPPKVVQTLLRYRAKGGRFRQKEDLLKVYGFRKADFTRLAPWVRISQKPPATPSKESRSPGTSPDIQPSRSGKLAALQTNEETPPVYIDVNRASQEEWQQLRGIGPVLSNRILKFRDKLGGFVSIEQIGETYGLPDSTFRKIKPLLQLSPVLKKIPVNVADLEELKAHPYISNRQAYLILNYRRQHGYFTGMESLLKIKEGFAATDWERLEAYLEFDSPEVEVK